MAVHSPTNFSGGWVHPSKAGFGNEQLVLVQFRWLLRFTALVLGSANNSPRAMGPGQGASQSLGILKTVAWVPPAEIRVGSTKWGLLGFCTKAAKGESASSRNTRI